MLPAIRTEDEERKYIYSFKIKAFYPAKCFGADFTCSSGGCILTNQKGVLKTENEKQKFLMLNFDHEAVVS